MRRVVTGLGVLALLVGALAVEARGGEKLKVVYSNVSPSYTPIWITKDTGQFERYGLEVEIFLVEGGTLGAQTLIGGGAEVAITSAPEVINGVVAGARLRILTVNADTLTDVLITAKGITRPEQLRGKRIGISRFGSESDLIARMVLPKLGLDPNRDVTILQVGGETTRFAALRSGNIDGTFVDPPITLTARKLGFNELIRVGDLGIRMQKTGAVTTEAFIRDRRATMNNFIKAYVAGIHYYKTRKEASIRIMAKYMKSTDLEAVGETYDVYSRMIGWKPYPVPEGFTLILQQLGERDHRIRALRPEQFIDPSFVRELDERGFIDALRRQMEAGKL